MSLIIDDTDSHWAYTPGWFTVPSSFAHNGASQCTDTDGASVTLRFRGKYILIQSVIPASNNTNDFSRVDMKLDDEPVVTFSRRAWEVPFHNNILYESSALPEIDHTLTLTFVDKPNTVAFCLDMFWLSSDFNSPYVPELLDPAPARREFESLERREVTMPSSTKEIPSIAEPVVLTIGDVRQAALTAGATGGLVVGIFMILFMLLITRRRKNTGEVKI